jgi:hypothetical protein
MAVGARANWQNLPWAVGLVRNPRPQNALVLSDSGFKTTNGFSVQRLFAPMASPIEKKTILALVQRLEIFT